MSALEQKPAPVSWAPKMQMRGGKVANYLGKDPITGRHRLIASNTRDHYDPENKETYTVWLLDDFGACRGDRAPSPYDVTGAA